MYHRHFSLRDEPFGVSPDGRFFLPTEQHREAIATLYYGIHQRRGFGLLVGEPGLGKTSVLVQLLKRLEMEAETAWLPHPYFDKTTVLESILTSLGIDATPSLAQNHRIFYEYLIKTQRSGKTCVVVVDEAQNLSRDTLEAIRMLSNFETPSEKLVQFVLSGQPALLDTLHRPDCEQIRQRVNVTARLTPLDPRAVREYMEHRLTVAGASTSLFSPEALQSIAAGSGGVPRNVNTICFNALTLAYALNRPQVGSAEVSEVLRDLDLTPLLPRATPSPEAAVVRDGRRVAAPAPFLGSDFRASGRSLRPMIIAAGVLIAAAGSFWIRSLFGIY
jgi:type II secretory pathway predicted ATPase ExeA